MLPVLSFLGELTGSSCNSLDRYWLLSLLEAVGASCIKVIAIKDIVRPPQRDIFNDVYIVYELMDTDLQRILRSNQTLSHDQCRVRLI